MQPTVEVIEHLASHLNAADRRELLARLSLAASTAKTKDNRDLDMWAEAVYRALDDAIGGRDGAGVGPLPIRRLLAGDGNWAAVQAFMKSSRLAELTVTERMSAYQLLARLLVQHAASLCSYKSVPLTAKFTTGQCGNLAAIFDNAFPGYVRAGLARFVVQRQAQGETT